MQIIEIVLLFAVGQFAVNQVTEFVVVVADVVLFFEAVVNDSI